MKALLVLVAITGCFSTRRDDQVTQRLANIEQRLDAQDKAIADARARADTTELSLLSQQIGELQKKLDEMTERLKARPPQRARRIEPDANVTYSVPLGPSPAFGSPKAKVTLVMAMEFDCPYCRRAYDTVDKLRKKYGKELRVVYKPYVVHPKTARYAAEAACAAHKQGRFRELADLLWTKAYEKKGVDPDAFSPERIDELAKLAKLDMRRFEADATSICVDEVRDEQAGMTKLGVYATPSFFINGRYMAGARPLESFVALIDEEMAKANAAIKSGVKPERYYDDEVVAKGKTEVVPAP